MEKQILSLIEEKKFTKLRSLLIDMNPADIAVILEEAEEKDLPVVFRILPKELAAELFSYLESDMQQFLIEKLSDTELKQVFRGFDPGAWAVPELSEFQRIGERACRILE